MDKQDNFSGEFYTIDIFHILKSLWKRAWVIVIAGILAGAVGFSVSAFTIEPTYASSVKLYVNNNNISIGSNIEVSLSQISAAQALVKTYGEILNTRIALERIIDKAEIDYSPSQLKGMINYGSSNETEIMYVKVTSRDPYEASKIANTIAEVLPTRISEVIDGASMEIVDTAIPNLNKVGPSITRYTAIGMFLGVFAAVVVLVILAMLDDTIHDEDYILRTYDYPILGKVPNLLDSGNKSYSYYYRKHQRSKSSGKEG